MTTPYSETSFDDDLHLLMAIAICGEQQGIDEDTSAIFSAWQDAYPEDALGPVGQGILKVKAGRRAEGIALVEAAVKTSKSRTDQAVDVLESLEADFAATQT